MKNQVRLQGREFTTTTQAPDRSDILNVGGCSDAVFDVLAAFFTADTTRFVAAIEAIEL